MHGRAHVLLTRRTEFAKALWPYEAADLGCDRAAALAAVASSRKAADKHLLISIDPADTA